MGIQQEHKPDNDAGLRIFLYRQLLLPLPPDARHRALLSFPRTYARIGTHIVHSDCLHPNAQHHCRMVLHNILGHNRAAPCLHPVSLYQGQRPGEKPLRLFRQIRRPKRQSGRNGKVLEGLRQRYYQKKQIKKVFSFFTLTPSHIWLKRPVHRRFRCEGKCEGSEVTLTHRATGIVFCIFPLSIRRKSITLRKT